MTRRIKWQNNIWKYRTRAGLSQKDVADLMGLKSASHISDWEQGVKQPSLTNTFLLAYALNIMPLELFSDLAMAAQQKVIKRRLERLVNNDDGSQQDNNEPGLFPGTNPRP